MTKLWTVSAGHTLLDSPRWHDDALYVSDLFSRQVLRFPNGAGDPEVVATVPGIPSGLGFLPDGTLLIVSMQDQTIYRLKGQGLEVYADLRGHVRGLLNDMLVDSAGRCYVGNTGHSGDSEADFGPTPLIIVQPNGGIVHAIDDLNFPNGIVELDDGRLLVAETYAGRVRALRIDGDGIPIASEVWAKWGPEITYFDIDRAHSQLQVEPDGLAAGGHGTAWVADANGHGIARVREGGEVVAFIDTGDLSVFGALAVGSRLFLCCAPQNRTVDWSSVRSSKLCVADIA